MKLLRDGDFKNKKVLVRCDFNVAIDDDGQISDDFRIVKTLPTIKLLAKNGTVTVLMSHLEYQGNLMSLEIVAKHLEKILSRQIKFLKGCVGQKNMEKEINSAIPGQILMLENLRFCPQEVANDDSFAHQLAGLGDYYVNEAFSCSHREHASIAGIPKYLNSYAGLLFEEEIRNLSKILKNPKRPLVAIIGGAKVEAKSKVIANILKIADHVLVGSKIGEKILAQKNQLMGRQIERPEPTIDAIDLTNPKIHLPMDGVLALKDFAEGYLRVAAIGTMRGEEEIYDIGPETIKIFAEIIKDAQTIFFSGPMGLFERPEFASGTKAVLEAILKAHSAYRVAGGGQTLEAIRKYKAEKTFNFLSTGGSAMLEYLAGNILPGVAALDINPEIQSKPAPLAPKN